MVTLHYAADRKALIDNAQDEGDRAAILDAYDAYCHYLSGNGVEVDYDGDQTTHCWSGAESWPDDIKDFWSWVN